MPHPIPLTISSFGLRAAGPSAADGTIVAVPSPLPSGIAPASAPIPVSGPAATADGSEISILFGGHPPLSHALHVLPDGAPRTLAPIAEVASWPPGVPADEGVQGVTQGYDNGPAKGDGMWAAMPRGDESDPAAAGGAACDPAPSDGVPGTASGTPKNVAASFKTLRENLDAADAPRSALGSALAQPEQLLTDASTRAASGTSGTAAAVEPPDPMQLLNAPAAAAAGTAAADSEATDTMQLRDAAPDTATTAAPDAASEPPDPVQLLNAAAAADQALNRLASPEPGSPVQWYRASGLYSKP